MAQRFEIVTIAQKPANVDVPGAVDLVMSHKFVVVPDNCIEAYMSGYREVAARNCNLFTVEHFEIGFDE